MSFKKNPTIREDFFDCRGGRLWCVTCERGLGQLDNIYIYIDRYIYIHTHRGEKLFFLFVCTVNRDTG